jgi:hypothetical protein
LGLVHQAHTTRFGRAHDFRRIRNPADFRRLVPLRTPAALCEEYWQRAGDLLSDLAGTTWPGPLISLAALPAESRFTESALEYLPLSTGLLNAHRDALRTALGLIAHVRPNALRNPCLLNALPDRDRNGSLPSPDKGQFPVLRWEELVNRETASLLGTANYPPAQEDTAEKRFFWTKYPLGTRITCLAGSAEQLLQLITRARQETGCARLVEIWPGLAAVLSTRGQTAAALRPALDDAGVLWLETYFPPEGPVAVIDPRYGLLRLLPDHGVYFEFVPVAELDTSQPIRHGAAEVEPGVPYALALTSPAGLWACLTGVRLCFERQDPPLLQLLDTDTTARIAHRAAQPFPSDRHHAKLPACGLA